MNTKHRFILMILLFIQPKSHIIQTKNRLFLTQVHIIQTKDPRMRTQLNMMQLR